jgi:ABC-2 type transport system permease protein
VNERLAHEPKPTDRGAWRLVAVRDFRVRLRDKGFFISTGITLTVLTVFIVLRAFGDEVTPSFDLGIIGRDPVAIERTAAELDDVAEREGVELRVGHWDDLADAEVAVRSGRLDAVLVDDELVGDDAVPATLMRLVQNALIRVRITAALEGGGVSAAQIEALLNQPSVVVRTLERQDPDREENAGIAFIAVLLAYGQLFGYGVWVATGVIEEKASRVVEILLSAIRPRQLLAGKIAGIGLLGIVQLAFIAAFAIGLSVVTGALEIPATAIGIALVVLVWFVMGFAFYAGLFAVSGSLVSRMEELQNAMVPINLIIFISFFISIGALESPDSPLSVVASVLPFSSALAMPVRIALGSATVPQVALSVALLVAGTAVLVPLSARLYAGAVLKTGTRVKLRDAWRSAPTTAGGG